MTCRLNQPSGSRPSVSTMRRHSDRCRSTSAKCVIVNAVPPARVRTTSAPTTTATIVHTRAVLTGPSASSARPSSTMPTNGTTVAADAIHWIRCASAMARRAGARSC
jgi:hypothetical protein